MCPEHRTKHGLGSCMLGTRCHPRASGFPSCPPCMALSGPSFALRSLWGKRLQESSWQAPNLEKLLSALSSSTRSFHFLLTSTHPPSPAPVCSAPSLPSQCWHFSGSGCWFGSSGHPAGAGQLAHTLGAGVSAQCLPIACRCQCRCGAFSTWWGVGQPLIRSTFKLSLQPFASPVEMPMLWPIPCPSHRDGDVPTVLLEQDSLGMRSPVSCPAHSPPVPQPSAAQQPPSSSSSASWGSTSLGCQGGAHQHPGA